MRVKTYRTRSIQQAVEHIKRDLGAEATILGPRPFFSRKPWGIRRRRWEVTAGIPEPKPESNPVDKVAESVPDTVEIGAKSPDSEEAAEARRATTDLAVPAMSEFESPPRLIRKAESRIEEVLEEIDELKRSVRFLGQAIPNQAGAVRGTYAELVGQGVDPEFAEKLIASATRIDPAPGKTRDSVRALLEETLTIEPPVELQSRKRVISVFIGPTGVGKTTTVAKLAAQASLRYGKKVALISTDAQRVNGQEQLSRYAQLMNVPSFKCSDTDALKELVQSLEDYNLILIDTAGCSPSNLAQLDRLHHGLDGLGARAQLVLSATTKSEDVAKIYKRFRRFSPNSVIFTKMDETDTRGSVVGELLRYLLPVSYLTNGQRVPEDLRLPDRAELAGYMLPVQPAHPRPGKTADGGQRQEPYPFDHVSKVLRKTLNRGRVEVSPKKLNTRSGEWKELLGRQVEFFKEIVQEMVQEVLEAEMDEAIGARKGDRNPNRCGYRNGYDACELVTRVGKLELRVPQERDGRFTTEIVERYKGSEKALLTALAEMYVHGVSAQKVKAITEKLCGHAFSASSISRISKRLEGNLKKFRNRRLKQDYPYLILGVRNEKVRTKDSVIRTQAVQVAIGIDRDGRRCVLGVELPKRESRNSWREFLVRLRKRGLRGVECVVTDDHAGSKQAVAELLPEAILQRPSTRSRLERGPASGRRTEEMAKQVPETAQG